MKGPISLWNCRCICGNISKVRVGNLTSGISRSCGCLQKERSLKSRRIYYDSITIERRARSATKRLIGRMKRVARERNYTWEIPDKDAEKLMQEPCYLCGVCGGNYLMMKGSHAQNDVVYGKFTYNGLDRVDNSQGYVSGNVRPCCGRCNEIKMSSSLTELIDHCRMLVTRFDAGLIQ